MIHWIFGSISVSNVIEKYKWSSKDSYGDIIDHIQWIKKQESADAPPRVLENCAEDHRETQEDPRQYYFFEIDDEEYFLKGSLYKFNDYSLEASREYLVFLDSSSSPFERLEIVKDMLSSKLGIQVFLYAYNLIKKKLFVLKESEHEIFSAAASLKLNSFYATVLVQILINERFLYG